MATATAPKRNWAAELQEVLKPKPPAIIFYGIAGVGKTSYAAHAPAPVFITDELEDRIKRLKAEGQVPEHVGIMPSFRNWAELLDQLDFLATGDHEYQTLVLDTLGSAEPMCHAQTVAVDYKGNVDKFNSFQDGYKASVNHWRELLNAIDRVRTRGLRFIGLAHAEVVKVKNPEAQDYGRYFPAIHPLLCAATVKWADAVLFANYYVSIELDNKKAKGKGGDQRFINTQWTAAYEAKNCFNLEPAISMGDSGEEAWGNFIEAIKAGRKAG
jgi:hypothetical protein